MVNRISDRVERIQQWNLRYAALDGKVYQGVVGFFRRIGDAFKRVHYRERRWHHRLCLKSELKRVPISKIEKQFESAKTLSDKPIKQAEAFKVLKGMIEPYFIDVQADKAHKVAAKQFDYTVLALDESLKGVLETVEKARNELDGIVAVHRSTIAEKQEILGVVKATVALQILTNDMNDLVVLEGINFAVKGLESLIKGELKEDVNEAVIDSMVPLLPLRPEVGEALKKAVEEKITSLKGQKDDLIKHKGKFEANPNVRSAESLEKAMNIKVQLSHQGGPFAGVVEGKSVLRGNFDEKALRTGGLIEAAEDLHSGIKAEQRLKLIPSMGISHEVDFGGLAERQKTLETSEEITIFIEDLMDELGRGRRVPTKAELAKEHEKFWALQWLTDLVAARDLQLDFEAKSKAREGMALLILRDFVDNARAYRKAWAEVPQWTSVQEQIDEVGQQCNRAEILNEVIERQIRLGNLDQ
jgi:hypothetical protein